MPSPTSPRGAAPAAEPLTIAAGVEPVLLAASAFFALTANGPFFAAALRGSDGAAPAGFGFAVALATLLVSLQFVLMAPVCNRWTVKPVLALLIVLAALASWASARFGVYFDVTMVRNVLRTHPAEARELLAPALLAHLLLHAALPLTLLSRVRVRRAPLARAAFVRVAWLLAAGTLALVALWATFQPLAALVRNHREVRYLVTPGNVVISGFTALAREARGAAQPRRPIGLDAAPGPLAAARPRPLVVVLVVGETARAANWGLNDYARQTTPQLAALPQVINFRDVRACGTNTEVSLPCLFAPVGRRDYDEARIRGSEGLLHVLARAGVAVHWRDNQSGCKGVCDGLPHDSVQGLGASGLCRDGRCLDEGLLHGLEHRLASARGAQLLVLHQLGNHGPSYFRRYPPPFARFLPACEHDDLARCSQQEIVNAYDNALLYTDHLLARLVRELQAHAAAVDSALLYVSDHGESLGERGLYLHGLPYAIAPDVQTQVPMVMWLSEGPGGRAGGLDLGCLRARAAAPAAHDDVFHTLLGLFDVRTALYEPARDLAAGCRGAAWMAARD